MTTAIVLSSYNGSNYIREQLISLSAQTLKADRVYISDDGSSDDTVQIVKNFIAENSLDNWQIKVNEVNKGWMRNFRDLLMSAEEDLIFLCDQDDIWMEDKLSTMVSIMEDHPEIDLLTCGYEPFYEDSTRHVNSKITADMKNSGSLAKIPMNEKFMNVLRPGCTFLVRKTFCKELEQFWPDKVAHDAVLWRMAAVKGTGYVLDKNLIKWRRYDSSSSNPNHDKAAAETPKQLRYRKTLEAIDSHLSYLDKAKAYAGRIDQSQALAVIGRNIKFEQDYKDAVTDRSFIRVLLCGMKNIKFFVSWKTIIADALMLKG